MKKKILFIISNPSQFKNLFRNKLDYLNHKYEINFLVYPYTFKYNKKLKIYINNWIKDKKDKKKINKVWRLKEYSYYNFFSSLEFILNLSKIIKEIKNHKIDIFFFTSILYFWEKILLDFFKKKKIFAYQVGLPTGLDLFNSMDDFYESIYKNKLIFTKCKFNVKSENAILQNINSNKFNISSNFFIFKFLIFILIKINIRFCVILNHYLAPFYFRTSIVKYNSIYHKLNHNYHYIKKIFVFDQNVKKLLKKSLLDKQIVLVNFNSKQKIKNNKKKWILCCSDASKSNLNKFFKIILILKKLGKIDSICLKKHPTWVTSKFNNQFINKINKIKISYKIINSYESIRYDKYYGLITNPSFVLVESQVYNNKIKLICTTQNNKIESGALAEFYKKNKNICWKINIINLRNYLNNSFKTYKNNFKSGFDFKKAIEKNIK